MTVPVYVTENSSNKEIHVLLWNPTGAKTRYILQWMKCVSHEKRCIFQLLRCIIPIWLQLLRE